MASITDQSMQDKTNTEQNNMTRNILAKMLFPILYTMVSGCSDSSRDVTESSESTLLSSRLITGYIKKRLVSYDGSGTQSSEIVFTIEAEINKVTRTNIKTGSEKYYYYNDLGRVEKVIRLHQDDLGKNDGYSTKSYEVIENSNSKNLLVTRTTDFSLNGIIDEHQSWQYDGDGILRTSQVDTDNDGTTDTTYSFNWQDEKLISIIKKGLNGGSFVETWNYSPESVHPIGYTKDVSSDGTIEDTGEYERDANENIVYSRFYNKNGELYLYFEREFQSTGDEVIENLDRKDLYYYYN